MNSRKFLILILLFILGFSQNPILSKYNEDSTIKIDNAISFIDVAKSSHKCVVTTKDENGNTSIKYFNDFGNIGWDITLDNKNSYAKISDNGNTTMILSESIQLYASSGTLLYEHKLKDYHNYKLSPNGEYLIEESTDGMDELSYFTKYGKKVVPNLPEMFSNRNYFLSFTHNNTILGLLASTDPIEFTNGQSYLINYDPVSETIIWESKIDDRYINPDNVVFSCKDNYLNSQYILIYHESSTGKSGACRTAFR